MKHDLYRSGSLAISLILHTSPVSKWTLEGAFIANLILLYVMEELLLG